MKGKVELELNPEGKDMAYVSLPAHPGYDATKSRTNFVHLLELMPDYKGAGVAFEFDADGEIIGISIFP